MMKRALTLGFALGSGVAVLATGCTGADPAAAPSSPCSGCDKPDGSSDTINGDPVVDGGDAGSTLDASGNADTGSDATGPWTPASLTGLVLWLDASKGVTITAGKVTRWADQSTRKTDFVTASNGPTVVPGSLLGHQTLDFTGVSLTSTGSNGFDWGASEFVIEFVAKTTGCTALPMGGPEPCLLWHSSDGAENIHLDVQSAAPQLAVASVGGGSAQSASFASAWHMIGVHRTGTSAEVRLDGVSTAATTSVTAAFANQESATIGGFTSEIVEVVAARNLATGDVGSIESYLKAKYGL